MPFPPANFFSNNPPQKCCLYPLPPVSPPSPSKFTSISSHPSLSTKPVLVKPTYGLHVAKSVTTLSPYFVHILAALDRDVLPLDSCPPASSPLLCPAFLL